MTLRSGASTEGRGDEPSARTRFAAGAAGAVLVMLLTALAAIGLLDGSYFNRNPDSPSPYLFGAVVLAWCTAALSGALRPALTSRRGRILLWLLPAYLLVAAITDRNTVGAGSVSLAGDTTMGWAGVLLAIPIALIAFHAVGPLWWRATMIGLITLTLLLTKISHAVFQDYLQGTGQWGTGQYAESYAAIAKFWPYSSTFVISLALMGVGILGTALFVAAPPPELARAVATAWGVAFTVCLAVNVVLPIVVARAVTSPGYPLAHTLNYVSLLQLSIIPALAAMVTWVTLARRARRPA